MQRGDEKDPERNAEYLQNETECYKKREKNVQIKSVSQLTERGGNLKRRQWRINKRNQRAKHKVLHASNQFVATNTSTLRDNIFFLLHMQYLLFSVYFIVVLYRSLFLISWHFNIVSLLTQAIITTALLYYYFFSIYIF